MKSILKNKKLTTKEKTHLCYTGIKLLLDAYEKDNTDGLKNFMILVFGDMISRSLPDLSNFFQEKETRSTSKEIMTLICESFQDVLNEVKLAVSKL